MKKYLVLADADRIHDYIFGSHELKLIRGASRLQQILAERKLPKLARPNEVIFAGGGRILVEFNDLDSATSFQRRAEDLYRRHTVVATVTTACVEYDGSKFGYAVQRVQDLLEVRKSARFETGYTHCNWFWSACERCGREPGSLILEGRTTCQACRRRFRAGRRSPVGSIPLPKDFGAIAAQSKPENYLALVYTDFDRLGRFLSDHGTSKADYKRWSNAIDRSVREAVNNTLARIGICDGQALFELLVLGGDDAIVAMAPQLVFDFVEGFYKQIECLGADRPHCSMGILIAHHQYPVRDFVAGAEELLRNAKKKAGDAVDYALLTQSMTDSTVAYRDRGADGIIRSKKPFSPQDFVELKSQLTTLKSTVASSRLRQLGRIVWLPKDQAELEYCYLLQRSAEPERTALLKVFGDRPWTKDGDGQWRSAVPDLMELWKVAE